MPIIINPNTIITNDEEKQISKDNVDPLKYRFGGFVFERDVHNDNIIINFRTVSQPSFWSQRVVTSFNQDLR
jgi:hypothetical protein